MSSNRLPGGILYAKLSSDQRLPGHPLKRFQDHIKIVLVNCNVPYSSLETTAAERTERSQWKSTCNAGLATFAVRSDRVAKDRRAQRHETANTCGSCLQPQKSAHHKSQLGLRNHLRVHTPPYYPHMPIGKVWILYCLLFVCLFLCVCTVTDFSADDKASGVTFCTAFHRRPRQGITHFFVNVAPRSPKSDESANARAASTRM